MSKEEWFISFGQVWPGTQDNRNRVGGMSISRVGGGLLIMAVGRIIPGTDRIHAARGQVTGGWVSAAIPHPGSGNPSNNEPFIIHASEHNVLNVWAGRPFVGNKDILYSTNQGGTWTVVEDDVAANTEYVDFHVPFNANANDQVVYWGEGDGAFKKVYLATDNFATPQDITPTAAGSEWGCSFPSPGNDMQRAIRTWDQNRLFVAMILQESTGAEANSCFFFATNGQTLQPTQIFTGRVTSLWWNKQNVNQLYMINTNDTANFSAILFTENGGLSWANLFSRWYVSLGGAGTQRWSNVASLGIPFTIQNVWTE